MIRALVTFQFYMALFIDIRTWCEIFNHAELAARCKCQSDVSRRHSHTQMHTEGFKHFPVSLKYA